MLIYIAAQSNPRGFLLPIVALFAAVVGWGLWSLKSWARNITLITTGMTVVLWMRAFLFDAAFGDATFHSSFERQTVYIVLLMDILVFLYLWNVPEAFGES